MIIVLKNSKLDPTTRPPCYPAGFFIVSNVTYQMIQGAGQKIFRTV